MPLGNGARVTGRFTSSSRDGSGSGFEPEHDGSSKATEGRVGAGASMTIGWASDVGGAPTDGGGY